MLSTVSEHTPMEDPKALEDEGMGSTDAPSSVLPLTTIPPPAPSALAALKPNFPDETEIEAKAVSVASSDCSPGQSSPAEASPAKPTVTPLNGSIRTSQTTSCIASASDSLRSTRTSFIDASKFPGPTPAFPSQSYVGPNGETDFPSTLTLNGVSVTLENDDVWKQFNKHGTEMVITKQGRRMFPYCSFRLEGLDPKRKYHLAMSIGLYSKYKYCRWSSKWEVHGPAEIHPQDVIRAYTHERSPLEGARWMDDPVYFNKLKLTNKAQSSHSNLFIHSMHRYIPSLHVIPVLDDGLPTDCSLIMRPQSMTFTFPQTEFMAVTAYQSLAITQLKINLNPFAKGFTEEARQNRLAVMNLLTLYQEPAEPRAAPVAQPVENTDTVEQEAMDLRVAPVVRPVQHIDTSASKAAEVEQDALDLRIVPVAQPVGNTDTASLKAAEVQQEAVDLRRIIPAAQPKVDTDTVPLKPAGVKEDTVVLSTANHTGSSFPPNVKVTRLVLKPIMSNTDSMTKLYTPCIRGKHALGELVLVEKQQSRESNEEQPVSSRSASKTSSLEASPKCFLKGNKIYTNWANLRRDGCSAATSAAVHGPPSTAAVTDDVEGQVFVSFTSKEALQVHSGDMPANDASSPPPVSITTQSQTAEAQAETDEEKIGRHSALLLQDLRVFKHRQVIHPVLQEVGMKLSSLDPHTSIDLQYLGVPLPLPPPKQSSAVSPDGVPFISRTGKTSDMTKIKGWRNKFTANKETSPTNTDGPQKNLSAFCSDMLDEYLESEARYISERADPFCSSPVDSVAYQLPVKSSSYVKTLDSVLKHRTPAPTVKVGADKPCPLFHKSPGYSAPTAAAAPPQAAVTPFGSPDKADSDVFTSPSLSEHHSSPGQRSAPGQRQVRPPGVSRSHMKLLQMESRALNQGLGKTQLTTDRLAVALSVMLTKQMLPSQTLKASQSAMNRCEPPLCGQDFCVLGCVCSSLRGQHRHPLHCRQPDCMLGCDCSKSVTNKEHVSQPHPGSHARKLWDRNVDLPDPDPLFAPKSEPVSPTAVRQSSSSHPVQPVTIREEDKDPVYKYFENMMTCARVRPFKSKPPSPPKPPEIPKPSSTEKPEKESAGSKPKMYFRTLTAHLSRWSIPHKAGLRRQMEIQSLCEWYKDRKRVLEALTRRMTQGNLPKHFTIEPYYIRLVARIFLKKPSGSTLTYRVRISKPSEGQNLQDLIDDCEDEAGDEPVDEDLEDAEMDFGITPFLRGVQPAGYMRARTKPAGCQMTGPIQVNGKSYNQAQLLLGFMGSLHPANRLAAYVTGRLKAPSSRCLRKPLNAGSSKTTLSTSADLHTKAAPVIKAEQPSEKKSPQAAALMSMLRARMKMLQDSKSPGFLQLSNEQPSHNISVSDFQRSPTSSVLLTVSPSLETPSFVGLSGTCSFRICPKQASKEQSQAGVPLPGGFTLIQLPKPSSGEEVEQPKAVKPPADAGADKAPLPKSALGTFGCFGAAANANSLDWSNYLKTLLSSKLAESEVSEVGSTSAHSNPDLDSEDDYFDSSDNDESSESDTDTAEKREQGSAISQMKQWVRKTLHESSLLGPGAHFRPGEQSTNQVEKCKTSRPEQERQRRSEIRTLLERLMIVLQVDHRTPTGSVLTLTLKEIQAQAARSEHLAKVEKDLLKDQAIYLKQLALLTGKSPQMIASKAKEICAKQKAREEMIKSKPFSNLLQTRAVHLQNAPQRPKPHTFAPPSQAAPRTSTALALTVGNQQLNPSLLSQLRVVSLANPVAQATAPSPQVRTQPSGPAVQAPKVPSAPMCLAPTSSAPTSSGSSVANSLAPKLSSPVALPLIRSKNGRLILPSSLKALGHGFYTLVVLDEKEKGKKQDSGPDSESVLVLKEDKGAQPADAGAKCLSVKVPAQPNHTVLVPVRIIEKSNEKDIAEGLNKTQGNPCLSFKPEPVTHESVAAVSEKVPPIRARGRPRKVPRSPDNDGEKSTEVKDSKRQESCAAADADLSHKSEAAISSTKNGEPVPVKRSRGRPPRRRSAQLSSSQDQKDSSEERLVFSVKVRSPDVSNGRATSRPLTRGALGKDFPSAKKRSWIDVEKELDPELDSE